MFKDLLNNINNKYNTIKEQNNLYKELLNTTTTISDFLPIPTQTNKQISEHLILYITNTSPDISKTKASIIANLIPINETYLDVYYAKEILTNNELFLIPTNLQLWIITPTSYKTLTLDQNQISIIKTNFMSKSILFNNTLLEINGTNEKINKLINILTNQNERQNIINKQTEYLCGIIPIYQQINAINSGISVDNDNNIVFHTKEKNYKYNVKEITNYEILLDNQTYYSKENISKTTINAMSSSCYQISIRITTRDNKIIIPILLPSTMGSKYQLHDTIFQTNINFTKSIIKKLNELSTNEQKSK